MTPQKHTLGIKGKVLLKDLNAFITCTLCRGYYVDATSLVDCLHVFCRGCILTYFQTKSDCPLCKKKHQNSPKNLRPDLQMQALVYKVVPGLHAKEVQRREDFYRSTSVRASSSCSDDSVIEREQDLIYEPDYWMSNPDTGEKLQFFSPDDSISLSLEYYQVHLDKTPEDGKIKDKDIVNGGGSDNSGVKLESSDNSTDKKGDKSDCDIKSATSTSTTTTTKNGDKRFLQCPAAVTMRHLQKFVRMKYGLTSDHKVDIIYKGEILPIDFSLMDVAYTFKWRRVKPMRFFYRIFTPMKVRPIKIINTTLSTGNKQLQIVKPIKSSLSEEKTKLFSGSSTSQDSRPDIKLEEAEAQQRNKEHLLAHLQLQSKSKLVQNLDSKKAAVPEKVIIEDCVFDYTEPDKEEIKRFAENRDREWAMMRKKQDEFREEFQDKFTPSSHHSSKKRKKNKHSKNESVHKKRRLHAEITSNEEEDLKLKVKITPHNGHKHKHHKSSNISNNSNSGNLSGSNSGSELSSKEKLLQMRQVRHKHVTVREDDKAPSIKLKEVNDAKTAEKPTQVNIPSTGNNLQKTVEANNNKSIDSATAIKKPPVEIVKNNVAKTTTSVQTTNNNPVKPAEWKNVLPIRQNSQNDLKAQKTFLKTFPVNADKFVKRPEKIAPSNNQVSEKVAKPVNNTNVSIKPNNPNVTNKLNNLNMLNKPNNMNILNKPVNNINNIINKPNNINATVHNKILERKIASLQPQCTIEAKSQNSKLEKKVSFNIDNTKKVPQCPSGFTVSKIEQGVKRKIQDDKNEKPDKRPSLEITLINPQSNQTNNNANKQTNNANKDSKPVAKRPPPATIPLERIKNLKAGLSIIPKMPAVQDKPASQCVDNVGALDLSNKSPESSPKPDMNGSKSPVSAVNNKLPAATTAGCTLSNLHMLSKVATEHSLKNPQSAITTTSPSGIITKPRPQIPNLQTLKIPSVAQNNTLKSNLAKLPKLNSIQKFRMNNSPTQIRSIRPNQNQNIRNIPNPSLLIRQQNQNRLNSINSVNNVANNKEVETNTKISKEATSNTININSSISNTTNVVNAVKSVLESSKIVEKKEISV